MKKLLLPLMAILLFVSCKKPISKEKIWEPSTKENSTASARSADDKIDICHKEGNGSFHTINISVSALPAHLAHGDVEGDCSAVVTTICNQVWMTRNLDVETYSNGDPIPEVTDNAAWSTLTTGAWCYYNNDPTNGTIYGKIYNWYAVNDPRGLAPAGWHVPTDAEWHTLAECFGEAQLAKFESFIAGGLMKSTGTIEAGTGLWHDPNTDATNSSGFTGLPGGQRQYDGMYSGVGDFINFWSSSELEGSTIAAWLRTLSKNAGYMLRSPVLKPAGLYVRCLGD